MSEIGNDLIEGMENAVAYAEGTKDLPAHIPAQIDVKGIRKKTGLTQAEFSVQFGFRLATLKDWEQGRYNPDHSNRTLLTIIDREPEAARRALTAA